MPDQLTFIEKSCGHLGFVRSNYPQDTIPCSQCSISMVDIDKILVPILKKVHSQGAVPEMTISEMNLYIKRQLEKIV